MEKRWRRSDLRRALGDDQLTAIGVHHHSSRLLVHRIERCELLDLVNLDRLQPPGRQYVNDTWPSLHQRGTAALGFTLRRAGLYSEKDSLVDKVAHRPRPILLQ